MLQPRFLDGISEGVFDEKPVTPPSIEWKLSYLYIGALLSKQLESKDIAVGKSEKTPTYAEPEVDLPTETFKDTEPSVQRLVPPSIFPCGPGGTVVVIGGAT
jgi:hypothetical protein